MLFHAKDLQTRARRACAMLVAAAFALPVAGGGRALAWGNDGHMIVALIAQHYLDPAAKKRVAALLKSDHDKLTKRDIASRATWADRFRDSDRNTTKQRYNATRQWHFVDIELSKPDLDAACFHFPPLPKGVAASKGPAKDCVVDKIDEFETELENKHTSKAERLLAFKFLLHFVGDIHQPLHAADNHDKGGNSVQILFGKHTAADNLHSYWDSVLIDKIDKDYEKIAAMLIDKYDDKQSAWMKGTPKQWALQSFALARDVVYKLPDTHRRDKHGVDCIVIDAAYDAKALPVVQEQLAKAGMRLAMLLNRALK